MGLRSIYPRQSSNLGSNYDCRVSDDRYALIYDRPSPFPVSEDLVTPQIAVISVRVFAIIGDPVYLSFFHRHSYKLSVPILPHKFGTEALFFTQPHASMLTTRR